MRHRSISFSALPLASVRKKVCHQKPLRFSINYIARRYSSKKAPNRFAPFAANPRRAARVALGAGAFRERAWYRCSVFGGLCRGIGNFS